MVVYLHRMKNLRHILVFTCMYVTCTVPSFAQSDWKLVYENDEAGNPLSGSISSLRDAVESGQIVRIGWGSGRVKHVSEASFLTIMKDSIVFAQIRPIKGQTPNFETGEIMFKENLEWSFIGGSNGKMTTIMRNVITGEVVDHRIRLTTFKWFVKSD